MRCERRLRVNAGESTHKRRLVAHRVHQQARKCAGAKGREARRGNGWRAHGPRMATERTWLDCARDKARRDAATGRVCWRDCGGHARSARGGVAYIAAPPCAQRWPAGQRSPCPGAATWHKNGPKMACTVGDGHLTARRLPRSGKQAKNGYEGHARRWAPGRIRFRPAGRGEAGGHPPAREARPHKRDSPRRGKGPPPR